MGGEVAELDLVVGCVVELNTRDVGVVVDVNARRPERPVIRLLWDAEQKPLSGTVEVDLAKQAGLSVRRVLDRPTAYVRRRTRSNAPA